MALLREAASEESSVALAGFLAGADYDQIQTGLSARLSGYKYNRLTQKNPNLIPAAGVHYFYLQENHEGQEVRGLDLVVSNGKNDPLGMANLISRADGTKDDFRIIEMNLYVLPPEQMNKYIPYYDRLLNAVQDYISQRLMIMTKIDDKPNIPVRLVSMLPPVDGNNPASPANQLRQVMKENGFRTDADNPMFVYKIIDY